MTTTIVNANTTASSFSSYIPASIRPDAAVSVPISIRPHARTLKHSPRPSPPTTTFLLKGPLPNGKWFVRPFLVTVKYDEGEVIITEPHFHIHAGGTTTREALAEFRYVLSEELDDLTADEEMLAPRLQAELHYLRSFIRTA